MFNAAEAAGPPRTPRQMMEFLHNRAGAGCAASNDAGVINGIPGWGGAVAGMYLHF